MLFSSMIFLFVFLPVVLIGYFFVLTKITHKNIFLLVASLFFYAWGEPVYVLIMLASIFMNYRFGVLIDSFDQDNNTDTRKVILWVAVLCNLAILFIFKYESFVVRNMNQVFSLEIESMGLMLPIGISFFTFQAISYIIDVYRKTAPVQKSILNLGLYISFFPQLIAGPIVRYNTIAEQIKSRTTNVEDLTIGIERFIIGLSKKIILSNNLAVVSEKSFAMAGDNITVGLAWLGAICYSLQILFDFSGYSDMAIGLGRIFGFHFDENFNYPYIAKSVTDFWRRWHISLSSWFRDYVFIPLGGSRVTKKRLILNLLIVWMLTGIWHGAAWQFIAWGMMYFVILSFEKLTGLPEKLPNRACKSAYRALTLLAVMVGWVLFGENSFTEAIEHLVIMLGLSGAPLINDLLIFEFLEIRYLLLAAVIASTPLLKWVITKFCKNGPDKMMVFTKNTILIGLFLISVSYLAIGAHNPFIYFNF